GDDAFYLAPLLWSGKIQGLESKIKSKFEGDGLGVGRRLLYCRLAAASPEGQKLLAELLLSTHKKPLQSAIVLALQEHVHEIPEKVAIREWSEKSSLQAGVEPEIRSSAAL